MIGKLTKKLGATTVVVMLMIPLLMSCASLLHGQMLVWGDGLWDGYAAIREVCSPEPEPEPFAQDSDPDLDTSAAAAAPQGTSATNAAEEQGDEIDDLFGDEEEEQDNGEAEAATAAPATSESADEDEDIFGDDPEEETSDPSAAATATSSGDVAGDSAQPMVLTSNQQAYCRLEKQVSKVAGLGITWTPVTMVLLLLFCALIATLRRHHIALRNPTTTTEDRFSTFFQLVGNAMVAASSVAMLEITEETQRDIQMMWIAGMGSLCLINIGQLIRPVRGDTPTSLGKLLATIPLYTWMAIISGIYFLAVEGHPSGLAIYLQKITEFSILYIQVGLYLWAGMLLRDTAMGQLLFDIIRPFKLPPEIFAVIVVIAAAIPTAYSGASGILVLALGATIYTELRRSGASQQRALAATAMSGSMGVVLAPCLLVVIVASLNLDVTTDELFHWGWRVFGVTAVSFAFFSWLMRSSSWRMTATPGAVKASMTAFRDLAPYLVIAIAVIFFFATVLNAGLDEHTAPYVIPVALLCIMPWDRNRIRHLVAGGAEPKPTHPTNLDTGTHIGALLLLMGLSACLGGVIERSEIIEMFPAEFA